MRIGFVLPECAAAPSGLDVYSWNLWRALASVGPEHEYVPVGPPRPVAGRAYLRVAWEQLYLPVWAHRNRVDLLHVPAGSAPAVRDRPCVLTLHDLGHGEDAGHRAPLGPRLYFGRMVPWSAQFASAVLADSESTKRQAVARLGLRPERISVVPLAAAPCYRPLPEEEVRIVRRRYDLSEPYFLQVGSLIPRKNVAGAVAGFARFVAASGDAHTHFVIAGGRAFGRLALPAEAERLVEQGRVRFLGHVPEEELVALYNGALAVVQPSFYEGFGLPLVEAFACGTPAIASELASLPEVAGDAALYVDPHNPDSIAEAMALYASSSAFRREMARRALARSERFSWQQTARQTLAVYLHALAGKTARTRQVARDGERREAP